jgi:glycosyltransferase involved in cell wall biosynthesis
MKILFVGLGTKDAMGEMYLRYCRLLSKSYSLYCLTNSHPTEEETKAVETLNVQITKRKPWTYFSLFKFIKMARFIGKVRPDLVFVFTCNLYNFLLMPFFKKYPLVCQIHDPLPHSGTPRMVRYLMLKEMGMFYKYSQKIVVAGDALRDKVISLSSLTPNSVSVIHFPLLSVDPEDDKIGNRNQELTNDVLFFGRNEFYKGLDVLCDALKLARTKPRTILVFKGDLEKVYRNKLDFGENVRIINSYIPGKELANLIASSKVCVFPYRDGTGTSTVGQSYQYGTPVIASNVGVFSEIVGDGGILVPPEDPKSLAKAIDSIVESPNLRQQLSDNSISLCETYFSKDKFISSYESVFLEAIRKKE